jgi:spore maturation protein CgeB
VPPADHAAFYSSSTLTLNITRAAMAEMGYCPSGRLFEAAACATPIVSDWWEGLDEFYEPGEEILIARNPEDVIAALSRPAAELRRIGEAARARTLTEHTAQNRASELVDLIAARNARSAATFQQAAEAIIVST